jgi:hypothetical protein
VTFAAPLALLALILVPLVVLLYTIAARWTNRDVSSLAFWEEALRACTSLRIRRLLRSLALLAAVLAAAVLAVGLARPLVRGRGAGVSGDTVLVLDATASMGARSGGGTRYDEAKDEAFRLAAGLRRGALMCGRRGGRGCSCAHRGPRGPAARCQDRRPRTSQERRDSPLFALGLRGPAVRPGGVQTDGASQCMATLIRPTGSGRHLGGSAENAASRR